MKWYRKLGYEGPEMLECYMKKKKSDAKVSFFQKYNKRWFILNFDASLLSYAPSKSKTPTCLIPFKDILRIKSDPSNDELRMATKDSKLRMLKRELIIYTMNRVYNLYFCDDDHNQKALWSCALNFIIKARDGKLTKKPKTESMNRIDGSSHREVEGFKSHYKTLDNRNMSSTNKGDSHMHNPSTSNSTQKYEESKIRYSSASKVKMSNRYLPNQVTENVYDNSFISNGSG